MTKDERWLAAYEYLNPNKDNCKREYKELSNFVTNKQRYIAKYLKELFDDVIPPHESWIKDTIDRKKFGKIIKETPYGMVHILKKSE